LLKTDIVVIGSGIAGLMYALEVAVLGEVLVISKKEPTEGSTWYAQGGIASVVSPLDSFDAHIRDTLEVGDGLCNEEIVNLVIKEGPESIARLVQLGAVFDKSEPSKEKESYDLGNEGGHSIRRILHSKDTTGAEIERALYEQALNHPNIRFLPNTHAIDFITKPKNGKPIEVIGVYVLDKKTEEVTSISAKITMLASGGAGKVYLYTSNPDVATGDGIAMAYRAGCTISNMEFFQFHPTCLFHPAAKSFLISEALRGEGARLLNDKGQPFMHEYDSRLELAPRDIVARAIDDQMKRYGADCVYLDISHKDPHFIKTRFPNIYHQTKELGFDMTTSPLPVVPAAHYCCGGVVSDKFGRTELRRLLTAGETAFTGFHGANRLASNSLLEAVVFARRAAEYTKTIYKDLSSPKPVPEWDYCDTTQSEEQVIVSYVWDEVRRLMWNLVGIVRSNRRLTLAEQRIKHIEQEIQAYYWSYMVTSDLVELRNIIDVAKLIILSAKERKESRGLHYNVDFPNRDDKDWRKNSLKSRFH
jgi:L-aspartate oxidase